MEYMRKNKSHIAVHMRSHWFTLIHIAVHRLTLNCTDSHWIAWKYIEVHWNVYEIAQSRLNMRKTKLHMRSHWFTLNAHWSSTNTHRFDSIGCDWVCRLLTWDTLFSYISGDSSGRGAWARGQKPLGHPVEWRTRCVVCCISLLQCVSRATTLHTRRTYRDDVPCRMAALFCMMHPCSCCLCCSQVFHTLFLPHRKKGGM